MEKKTIELYRKKFDDIRHKSDSIEYWYARELINQSFSNLGRKMDFWFCFQRAMRSVEI